MDYAFGSGDLGSLASSPSSEVEINGAKANGSDASKNAMEALMQLQSLAEAHKESMKILDGCFNRCVQRPEAQLTSTQQSCIWNCTQRLFDADSFIAKSGRCFRRNAPTLLRTSAGSMAAAAAASEKQNWTQHTASDGRAFWHNKKDNTSTWEKPECLKTDLERLVSAQTEWKEYKASDGRPYWFNKSTKQSVWECPPEVSELKSLLEDTKWEDCIDKTEARQKLKILFRVNNLNSKIRWEDAQVIVKNDARFRHFACLTTGERKQAFIEYQNQLTKELKEKERTKKVRARQMFTEAFGSFAGLSPATTLASFEAKHQNEWWLQCLPATEKNDLFNDLMEDFEEPYWEQDRQKRELLQEKLLTFFEDSPLIDFEMPWSEVSQIILQEASLVEADPKDIVTAWQSFVSAKDGELADEYAALSYTERRKRRDAFRNFVSRLIKEEKIKGRAIFADFAAAFSDAPEYRRLCGVPLATPREIFEIETEPLAEQYEKEKAILKSILRANENVRVTATSTLEELKSSLSDIPTASQISDSNLALFYDSLKRRALRRERNREHEESRRRRRHDEDDDDSKTHYHRSDSRRHSRRTSTHDRPSSRSHERWRSRDRSR